VNPDVFVMMESEIWPNLLFFAKKRGVPTVLVSGRVSERAFRRALRFRWLMSWALSGINHLCMQTETDAKRIKAIGARSGQVSVFGCTKFDADGERLSKDEAARLRRDLGIPEGVRVFIAGSTNYGEEEPVLGAFLKLRRQMPDLRLIIAPRKIERADKIWAQISDRGLVPARRTCKREGFDVLIIDTLGELARVYAVGDIAFVGGTLVRKGGHNLIQPIIQGKPVLFGPHTFKTSSVAEMLISEGVGFRVENAEAMAERASALLASREAAAVTGAACNRLISENRGASARCAGVITALLKKKEERASAA
jgi:3-deoxy-D-manno-octulosonic-acid transferase